MNNEEHYANRSCRAFVLALLGIMLLAFVLVLGWFHRPIVGKQHSIPTNARARRG